MRTERKPNVYESLTARIRRDIALGILAEGEKLPSCRDLALEEGINPNTVQRAYSALEEEGIIESIPKKGVYVRKPPDVLGEAAEQLRRLKEAGVTKEQLSAMIETIYSEEKP